MRTAVVFLVLIAVSGIGLTTGVNGAAQAPGPNISQVPGGPPGGRAPGPPMPPRDAAREQEGTARVSGRIYAGQGIPLRRAQVVLANQGNRRYVTTTDAEGHYEFDKLPAGRYTLSASKAGHVTLQFGQRIGVAQGTPLSLSAGEHMDRADITLPRGTVIVVRVTDEFGDPFPGVTVQLQRYTYGPDGQRQTASVQVGNPSDASATDDRGEVRLFGLMPGDYLVTGSVRSMGVTTASNISDTSQGYPTTYYPGTLNPDEATILTVGVSEEQTVQFAMTAGRLARLSGRVVDMSGNPVARARMALGSGSTGSLRSLSIGTTSADGSFSAAGITPGQYTIQALPLPAERGTQSSGVLPITVTGDDVSGLEVVMGANATLRGTVVFDGAPPRLAMATFRVTAPRADGMTLLNMTPMDPASSGEVTPTGQFQLMTYPGRVLLGISGASGWALRSITAGGKDLLDTPIALDTGTTLSDIRIVLTDKVSTVTGRGTDAAGRPQTNYAVVLLPADARDPAVVSRLSRYVRPGTDGVFEVSGLRPGRYVAAAFDALDSGRQFAPAVQDYIRQRGRAVTLAEGQTVTLDLPIGGIN